MSSTAVEERASSTHPAMFWFSRNASPCMGGIVMNLYRRNESCKPRPSIRRRRPSPQPTSPHNVHSSPFTRPTHAPPIPPYPDPSRTLKHFLLLRARRAARRQRRQAPRPSPQLRRADRRPPLRFPRNPFFHVRPGESKGSTV